MHWRLAASVSLAVLAILPFLGGAGGGFIGDDVPIIKLHSGLREGGNAFGAFAETYWRDYGAGGLYRPLTVSSFSLDRVVWGVGWGVVQAVRAAGQRLVSEAGAFTHRFAAIL